MLQPFGSIEKIDYRAHRHFQFVQISASSAAAVIAAANRSELSCHDIPVIAQLRHTQSPLPTRAAEERTPAQSSTTESAVDTSAMLMATDAQTQTSTPVVPMRTLEPMQTTATMVEAATSTTPPAPTKRVSLLTQALSAVEQEPLATTVNEIAAAQKVTAAPRQVGRKLSTSLASPAAPVQVPSTPSSRQQPIPQQQRPRSAHTSPTRVMSAPSSWTRGSNIAGSPPKTPPHATIGHRRTPSHSDKQQQQSPQWPTSTASITVLPDDMLSLIFTHLDGYDLVDAERVSTLWRRLVCAHWRRLVLQLDADYGLGAAGDHTNWKRLYVEREATRFDKAKLGAGGQLSDEHLTFCKKQAEGGDWDRPCIAYGELLQRHGRRYFEVRVREGVKIHVGVAVRRVARDKHVGELPDGFACYSRTGQLFSSSEAQKYAAPWKRGDRIGCLVDMDRLQLEFFVNGQSLGAAFVGQLPTAGVYPAVSVEGINDCVELVLGARPGR
eukprot:TRINITY_DN3611_c0_g1_i1.p1 TRINITY_DN3611_c0_g1~~TRINITY_DN3611_c0_g1_i1.p1  ORF type:complete len:496 (-),score=106.32 TRINITY_DN3611_c0_g1_i1:433-1920(-)